MSIVTLLGMKSRAHEPARVLRGLSMKCPICESDPVERFRACHVQVLKCGNCGHLYAEDPSGDQGVQEMPDPDAARRAFGERNRRLVRRWCRDGFLYSALEVLDEGPGAGHIVETIRECTASKVLDVGSGAGHIVEAIREGVSGAKIVCMEADPRGSAYLRAQGFAVVDNFDAVPFRATAVLLIELIEHINDPVALLRDCKHVLSDGGRLFLTTPCGETRSGYRNTNAYDTAEHVQFFTERSLTLACKRAGFQSVNFISPACMHAGGGVA